MGISTPFASLTYSIRWKCPAGIDTYFHSQKRLALPRSPFSYARARASTERAMSSPRPFGGNALRALTPTFTRKSALRSRARLFLMPALVQARSGLSHSPFGGNALRALPPTFTRKSALRSRARLFLMPALVQARSGLCPHPVRSVGMPCGHCPLLSLAKAPCALALAFFLCPRSCKHGAGIRKTPALLTERDAFARWCRWSDSNRHGFYSTGF